MPEALDEYVSDREALLALCEQVSAEDLQLFYQIGLIGRRDLQLAPDLRGGLEMLLLRMLAFRPVSVEQPRQVESPVPTRKAPSPEPVTAAARQTVQAEGPAVAPGGDWRSLVESMQLKGVLRELAMNCALKSRDNNNWTLVLDTSHQQLLSKTRQQRLEESLCQVLQQPLHVDIEVQGSADNTPAQQQLQEAETRQADAVNSIESDPNVKALLINIFGGIVRCDRVAQGVIDAVNEVGVEVPVVVRLEGTNAEEAQILLENSGLNFEVANSLKNAAEKVTSVLN